jgi:hypothetical protein
MGGAFYADRYSSHIVDFLKQYIVALDPLVKAFEAVENKRIQYDHYRTKVEALAKGAPPSDQKGIDKMDRNKEKLEEAELLYSQESEKLVKAVDEVIDLGYEELRPLLLKISQWERMYIRALGDDMTKALQEVENQLVEQKPKAEGEGFKRAIDIITSLSDTPPAVEGAPQEKAPQEKKAMFAKRKSFFGWGGAAKDDPAPDASAGDGGDDGAKPWSSSLEPATTESRNGGGGSSASSAAPTIAAMPETVVPVAAPAVAAPTVAFDAFGENEESAAVPLSMPRKVSEAAAKDAAAVVAEAPAADLMDFGAFDGPPGIAAAPAAAPPVAPAVAPADTDVAPAVASVDAPVAGKAKKNKKPPPPKLKKVSLPESMPPFTDEPIRTTNVSFGDLNLSTPSAPPPSGAPPPVPPPAAVVKEEEVYDPFAGLEVEEKSGEEGGGE